MSLPNPGDRFAGVYLIEAEVGRGRHGVVFTATGPKRSPVFVEILDMSAPDGPRLANDFARIAQTLDQLRHPAAPEMIEYAQSEGGDHFLVLARRDGPTLDVEQQRGRRFDEAQTVGVLMQLVACLADSHGRGVMHGRLQPSNIRIVEDSGPSIGIEVFGFGFSDSELHPQNPHYAAPEQLRGWNVAAATDVYSAGLIAYEMLMGPRAPGQLVRLPLEAGFSPPLTAIINGMLATELPERFSTAHAVFAPLTALARPAAAAHGGERRTDPIRIALLALVAVIFGSLGWLIWRAYNRPPPPTVDVERISGIVEGSTPETVDVGVDPVDTGPGRSGCDRDPEFVGFGTLEGRAVIDAEEWDVYVPKKYDPARKHSMLVYLGDDFLKSMEENGWKRVADRSSVIMVVPKAKWVGGAHESAHATIRRVSDVVRFTDDHLCLDRTRIYVVGADQYGSQLAEATRCEVWVAGIAMINDGNTWEPPASPDCPGRAVPFISIEKPKKRRQHCSHDGTLSPSDCQPIRGGKSFTDIRLKHRNQCKGKPKVTHDKSGDVCKTWACDVPYESCQVRSRFYGGFGAAARIWKFFDKAHKR